MRFKLFFVSLVLVYFDFDSVKCSAEDIEANCDTICKCEEVKNNFSTEHRAVCEGDGTKGLVLNKKIFEKEPVPDLTRKSYVRIKNFAGAKIKEDFLAQWLSYTSCSFDIWDSGKVIFPQKIPPIAKTYAYTFVFAGVGVLKSSIKEFPEEFFKNRSSVGLKFLNSRIDYLNVFKLAVKNIHYLIAKNTSIKVFEGNPSKSLTLVGSYSKDDANIKIEDSEIGYLSENALSFYDYQMRTKASVKIVRSTIGIMEKSAIQIGRHISLEITRSNLNYVSPFAFSFVGKRKFSSSITMNFIGVEEDSMKHLNCDSSLQIQNNLIYTKKVLSDCIPDSYEANKSTSCYESLEISNYLDSSCSNNHIIGKYHVPQPTEPLTTVLTTTSTTTTTLPTTTATTSITTTTSTAELSPTTPCMIIVYGKQSALASRPDEPLTTDTSTTPVPTTSTTTTTLPAVTATTSTTKSLPSTPCVVTTTALPSKHNVTSGQNTSEIDNSGFASKFGSGPKIPFFMFYLVISLCLFLILMVALLTGILIYGKINKKKNLDLQCSSCKAESCIYEEPEAYFTLGTQPQVKHNIETFTRVKKEEKDEEERYFERSSGKKQVIELEEDNTSYLNMG